MFQWFEGYANIVEREPDKVIYMHDAQGHGWEAVRNAHGAVLDSIELGEFYWTDEFKVADCRGSAITNQAKAASYEMREARTDTTSFSSNAGGNNRNSRGGKPMVRNCDFYNRGI
jgi:hypothetical protein